MNQPLYAILIAQDPINSGKLDNFTAKLIVLIS